MVVHELAPSIDVDREKEETILETVKIGENSGEAPP
jgi:hypothetical protein